MTRQDFPFKRTLYFPFKTNGRKCHFECPVHRIINCKIEGAYLCRVRSIFLPKNYIMTFSENKFSDFER